jgi:hypothetical protein
MQEWAPHFDSDGITFVEADAQTCRTLGAGENSDHSTAAQALVARAA